MPHSYQTADAAISKISGEDD